jgi:hypothetical protein
MQRHIEIVQGDDYTGGRSLTATGNAWGSDISEVRLFIWPRSGCAQAQPVVDVLGTYSAPTDSLPAIATVSLPRLETLKLAAGVRAYNYEFKGLTTADALVSLEQGALTVLRGGL